MTLWVIMEDMHPFTKVLYFKTDAQIWRYSFPLKPNTVPAIAVPALAWEVCYRRQGLCKPVSSFLVVFTRHPRLCIRHAGHSSRDTYGQAGGRVRQRRHHEHHPCAC